MANSHGCGGASLLPGLERDDPAGDAHFVRYLDRFVEAHLVDVGDGPDNFPALALDLQESFELRSEIPPEGSAKIIEVEHAPGIARA